MPLTKQLFIHNGPYLHPKARYEGRDKVQVDMNVFKNLGYEILFVADDNFKSDRTIAFNGTPQQKCVSIIGQEDEPTGVDAQLDGKNPPGINGTPMNSGKVTIFFFNLEHANKNMTNRTNVFDHEVGHSCYLAHHEAHDENGNGIDTYCPMKLNGLFVDIKSDSIQEFCGTICKKKTRIKQ